MRIVAMSDQKDDAEFARRRREAAAHGILETDERLEAWTVLTRGAKAMTARDRNRS
jgi:hypothetical protein